MIKRTIQDKEAGLIIHFTISSHKSNKRSGLPIGATTYSIRTSWYVSCLLTLEVCTKPFPSHSTRDHRSCHKLEVLTTTRSSGGIREPYYAYKPYWI